MKSISLPQLSEIETLRGNPVILFAAAIGDESVSILYECLRKQGQTAHLDLVLSTVGGNVTTAHQIALLLREYTQHLTILIPYQAMSSGTLLCLSANELVLGPMAALGPIDPHVGSAGLPPLDAPGMISAQDVRAFREMAEQWFGVTREDDRLQTLALVAQRVFPTSLSSFYRYDLLTQQIANELLAYQLPNVEAGVRQQIVEHLVHGYYAHDYIISRREARKLGLQVRFASSREETLLWDLQKSCRLYMTDRTEEQVRGLIVSPNFSARLVQQWVNVPSRGQKKSKEGVEDSLSYEKIRDAHWEFDCEGVFS